MPTFIEGFEIDAVISEERTAEVDITDHPVEKGVSITDHARVRPRILTMQCIVSDTPFGGLMERRGIQTDEPGAIGLSSGPLGDYLPSDVARAWLESLMVARKPVMVSTEWTRTDGGLGYKAYDNMLIQSLVESITPDGGDAASFTVTFKQIVFVTNERTVVKVAVPKAKKKVNRGNKAGDDSKEPPKEKVDGARFIYENVRGNGGKYELGKGVSGAISQFFGGF